MKSSALLLFLLPLTAFAQTNSQAPADQPVAKVAAPVVSNAAAIAASISDLVPRCVGPTTMGGRVADIAVYEKNPRIFYVAAAEGGIWKTENDGITFTALFQKQDIASLGSVVVSQKDPNLVWVGTGEPASRNSVGYGAGVYKSTDGGVTWTKMGLDKTMYVSRIIIDPNDNNTVYVGGLGDLWGPSEDRGLYKTTDGGKNWKKLLYVDTNTGIGDMVMDPSNHNTLFAAAWQRRRLAYDFINGGPGGGLYKSTDAGKSWKKITKGLPPGPFGRIGLNFFRKDPRTMVATIEYRAPDDAAKTSDLLDEDNELYNRPGYDGDAGLEERELVAQDPQKKPEITPKNAPIPPVNPDKVITAPQKEDTKAAKAKEAADVKKSKVRVEPELPRGGTYLSHDGGNTWIFTNTLNPRPFYFSIPRYDPLDVNRIYVPGVSLSYTEDAGKTFRVMHETVHVDHHAMWIDPSDSNHMMVGEDGGVGVTYDRGKNWRMLNNMPIGQFYIATYDMRKPYWVYGGLQDNGCWALPTQTKHGGVTYQDAYTLSGGDGFYVQVDPTDWTTAYSESQGGGLVRTNQATGDQKFIGPRPPKGDKPYRFNWNTPVLMSPFNPRTIYVGGNMLCRSYDRGDHWQTISPDLSTNDPDKQHPGKSSPTPDIDSGAERHCTIVTISESPMKAGLIWCGTDDGNVQVTQDGGTTWTNVVGNIPGLGKNLWVSRVLASKFAEGRAYVTVDGHRSDDFHAHVFMTDDYGKTWTSISNGVEDKSVYVIQEGAKNQDLLFVGHETGIDVSTDRGKTWVKYDNKDFPNVPVYDLEIQPRDLDLIVATHGRSIWTVNISGLEQSTSDTMKADAAIFQPKDVLTFGTLDSEGWDGDQTWVAKNTQPGVEVQYFFKNDLKDDATIVVSDIMGNASGEFKAGKTAGFHVYTWNGTLKGRRVQPGDYKVTLKANGKEYATSVHVEDASASVN
jgi:photosystem II stability/assembly factor-like uncharacterized protein